MRMDKKTVYFSIVVIAITALIGGYFWMIRQNPPFQNQRIIKVGAILPLSGEAAQYGETAKKSIDLAVSKLAKEQKITISIIYEDDKMNPKLAVNAFQKLQEQGVKYVIGFGSGETLALCPLAERNKIVLMSAGSSPKITSCGDYTFRDYPSDVYQGKVLAEKVFQKGYKNVALLYINNEYGVGLKNEFEKSFQGNIIFSEAHEVTGTDFRTQLTKLKSIQSDAIVLISQFPEGARLITQKSELGLTQPIFGSEALKDPKLIESIPSSQLNSAFVISVAQYDGNESQEFEDTYQQNYNEKPGSYGDYAYDNTLLLGAQFKKCSKDASDCVKNNLYSFSMIGATGKIAFDQNGDVASKPYNLYRIENKEFQEVN